MYPVGCEMANVCISGGYCVIYRCGWKTIVYATRVVWYIQLGKQIQSTPLLPIFSFKGGADT